MIDEGIDTFLRQGVVEMAGEGFAGVLGSKTDEYVVNPSRLRRRRRRERDLRLFLGNHHCLRMWELIKVTINRSVWGQAKKPS